MLRQPRPQVHPREGLKGSVWSRGLAQPDRPVRGGLAAAIGPSRMASPMKGGAEVLAVEEEMEGKILFFEYELKFMFKTSK